MLGRYLALTQLLSLFPGIEENLTTSLRDLLPHGGSMAKQMVFGTGISQNTSLWGVRRSNQLARTSVN